MEDGTTASFATNKYMSTLMGLKSLIYNHMSQMVDEMAVQAVSPN